MHRGGIILLILAALGVGGAAVLFEHSGGSGSAADATAPAVAGEDEAGEEPELEGEEGRAENELLEEQEVTEERLEALEEAVAEGRFGRAAAPTSNPAPGWRGSRLLNPATDDWEPARRGRPRERRTSICSPPVTAPAKTCSKHCPTPSWR